MQLFGTDISEAALVRARAGIYSDTIVQTLSADRLREFFHKVDDGYRINKSIQRYLHLCKAGRYTRSALFRLNLISCRNVLIYLGSPLQKTVFSLFHYALNADGLLFLGGAETAATTPELFRVVDGQFKLSLVQRLLPACRRRFRLPDASRASGAGANRTYAEH